MGKLLTRFMLPMALACATLLGATNPARATYPESTRPVYLGTGGVTVAGGSIDANTGAAFYNMSFGSVLSYGRQTVTGGFVWKGQDNSSGPFGPGTFMKYDWFLQGPNGNLPPMELVGPGNSRFLFSTQDANGNWIDTRDPEMLGAVMHVPQPPTYGVSNYLIWRDGTKWVFDPYGSKGLVSIYDPHGNVVIYWIYRDSTTGLASKILLASGTPDQYRYIYFTAVWPSTLVTQVTVSYDSTGTNNKVWNLTYDGSGRLSTVTNPLGGVWHYSWTTYVRDDGQTVPLLASVTDPRGNVLWSNLYDSVGRVTRQTYADAGYITLSYPGPIGTNGITTVTDQRSGTHLFGCQWYGGVNGHLEGYHLANTTDALGRVTQWGQLHSGSLLDTLIIDYRNRNVTMTWDWAKGNLLTRSWTTPLGNTSTETYGYDPITGQRTSSTDALGRTSTSAVNTAGDITTLTDPRGNQTVTTRNSYGDITAATNALSQTTNMTYGTYGTLLTKTDPLNHTTTRMYDVVGRLASFQDANGKTTTYTYDLMDRLLTTSRTVNGTVYTTAYVYDANGNRTSITDPKNQTWNISYDTMNRAYQGTNPLTRSVTFGYDLAGNPTTITDRVGNQETITYDAANRPLVKTFKKPGGVVDSTVTYNYNGTTKLLSSIVDTAAPGSQTWTYSYDTLDRITSIAGPNGTTTFTLNDKVDRRDALLAGSQPQVTYGFDNADNLTSILQSGQTATLTYDQLNRLSQQSLPTTPNPITTTWSFDAAGRATSVTSVRNGTTLDSHTYTRDAVGTITQQVMTGSSNSTSTFGYDDLYRLTSATVAGTAYIWGYDAAGNRTSQTVGGINTTYTYNAADELTAVNGVGVTSDLNGRITNDGAGSSFTWDARGRLATLTKSGVSYSFQYGPDDLRLKKTVGSIATTYLLDGGKVVTENIGGTLYQTIYGPGSDHPIARNGEFFLPNQLGSTTMLTNSAGTSIQSYQYSPFGGLLNSPTDNNPFQFTGRENDGDGLYYYRARYYSPILGRFVSPDTNGGMNPFSYCENNPISITDPSGNQMEPPFGEGFMDREAANVFLIKGGKQADDSVRDRTGEPLSAGRSTSTAENVLRNLYAVSGELFSSGRVNGFPMPHGVGGGGWVNPDGATARDLGMPIPVWFPRKLGMPVVIGRGHPVMTNIPDNEKWVFQTQLALRNLLHFLDNLGSSDTSNSTRSLVAPPLPPGDDNDDDGFHSQLPVYNGGPLTPDPNMPPPGFSGGPGVPPGG